MLPARAGMSPINAKRSNHHDCAPRASGDEPKPLLLDVVTDACSPRERG